MVNMDILTFLPMCVGILDADGSLTVRIEMRSGLTKKGKERERRYFCTQVRGEEKEALYNGTLLYVFNNATKIEEFLLYNYIRMIKNKETNIAIHQNPD